MENSLSTQEKELHKGHTRTQSSSVWKAGSCAGAVFPYHQDWWISSLYHQGLKGLLKSPAPQMPRPWTTPGQWDRGYSTWGGRPFSNKALLRKSLLPFHLFTTWNIMWCLELPLDHWTEIHRLRREEQRDRRSLVPWDQPQATVLTLNGHHPDFLLQEACKPLTFLNATKYSSVVM